MSAKLSQRVIKYAVRYMKRERRSSEIASELGVSSRRIRQIYAEYKKTGNVPKHGLPGRPKKTMSQAVVSVIIAEYYEDPCGVVRLTRRLALRGKSINYSDTYKTIKAENLTVPSKEKSKRRKWVRYERRYSNSL